MALYALNCTAAQTLGCLGEEQDSKLLYKDLLRLWTRVKDDRAHNCNLRASLSASELFRGHLTFCHFSPVTLGPHKTKRRSEQVIQQLDQHSGAPW